MATLNLTKLWINLLATGQAVSGYSDPDRVADYEIPGDMVTFASGRQRSITSAGQQTVFKVALVDVSRTVVDTLILWQGQTVQVRDNLGRVFVGTYYSVSEQEIRGGGGTYQVGFALKVATVDEGV